MLVRMFMAGAGNLEANRDWINELNVFPVPDGDTGTNMTMTILSAVKEVNASAEDADMRTVCKAMSSGSLRGARGNSGVILSQLLRGFCKVVRDVDEIDVPVMADAIDRAVETAYKAVMKPKEGTILTVARGGAEKSRELANEGITDFDEFLPAVIEFADEMLRQTPEMLPVLKQAGVVDSGGQGLMQVLKGAYQAYRGEEIDYDAILRLASGEERETEAEAAEEKEAPTPEELKYGYRTAFYVLLEKNYSQNEEKDFRKYLQTIGMIDTLQRQDTMIRVDVQTNNPGLAIQRGLLYGQLIDPQVTNLRAKNTQMPSFFAAASEPGEKPEAGDADAVQDQPRKETGFIAVSVGDGIEEIFKGLGVDYVISGGQTMNPSTEDILKAIDKVNASTVFILPNNKNIIMAANQAAELMTTKKVVVIPTKTIPQGITAIINYMPDVTPDVSRENMLEEIGHVKTIEVTYAVRDTNLDGQEIREGDMMAIGDDGIICVGSNYNDTALDALVKTINEETEIISIYYGADVTEEEAEALRQKVAEKCPHLDVEMQSGGQPIYYYILSAE
ncbi:MAG: DAK2 domain-containing protein [Lachnospiraceae bacterium]|nr:DAK2 domain-containing protein [Lachnospiraceae bacterium]